MDISDSDQAARFSATIAVLPEEGERLLIERCRLLGLALHDRSAHSAERFRQTARLFAVAGRGERLARRGFGCVPLAEALVSERDHVQQRRRFTRVAELARLREQLFTDGDRFTRGLSARRSRALAHSLEA